MVEMKINSLNTEKYENRIVVLIDIIGFKNFIDMNGYEVVLSLFNEIAKQVSEGKMSLQHGWLNHLEPALTFFSDTIFISFPENLFNPRVLSDNYKDFVFGLGLLRIIVSRIQNIILKSGLLTRGAIAFGEMYHTGNKWFGPALNEAHKYESLYAIFPRVILAPSVVENFKKNIEASLKSSFKPLYLCDDGFYAIEHLAWIHSVIDDDYVKAHGKIRAMIISKLDSLLDEKAKINWRWFANYFNKFTQTELIPHHGDKLSLI